MLRKLILLGVVVGAAAAVPAFYQRDPDRYHALIRDAFMSRPAEEPQAGVRAAPARRVEIDGETRVLLGKRVSISADARGHYMGRFKLNGREVGALVDTGATYIAINRSTARRIGINLSAGDFRYKVNTANGQTKAAATTIDTLQIGRIFVENVDAVVLEDQALDGVLVGMSFLKRLARFRVEDGALVLEQ